MTPTKRTQSPTTAQQVRHEIARRIVLISSSPDAGEIRRLAPQAARMLRMRVERDPEFNVPKTLLKRLEGPVSSVVQTTKDIRSANRIVAASVVRVWKAQHPRRPRGNREDR